MKSTNEISSNIRAIRQTRQITNAMYLLSASRAKRGLQNVAYNDTYMRRICASVKDVLTKSPDVHNSFIDGDSKDNNGSSYYFVIASDKSLCGAYNSNVANFAAEKISASKNKVLVHTCGSFATDLLKAKGISVEKEWSGMSQYPSTYNASVISDEIIDFFKTGLIKEAFVIFTNYITSAVQNVEIRRLLPLTPDNWSDISLEYEYNADILYEPSIEDVFTALVPQYIEGYIYGCMCNSIVSENYIRMGAMQSATDNADEMIKSLNSDFNAARQLAITNELTEIAAAATLSDNAI